jgi:tRNA pseudouridine55 synthase
MVHSQPSLQQIKEGVAILIDKPYKWSSFDAINKIKWNIKKVKIGHCGTLDPLATGLLICCTGKMTKQISTFQKQIKEYTGVITLGAVTPTFDLESEPEQFKSIEHLDEATIKAATASFIGEIQQVPPIHSAIKKDGKPVYKLARAGKEVILEPRTITIDIFEITKIEDAKVHFRVVCSTGTYIRSLANDFGAALGCGGYLSELRRTKIGDFSVDDAWSVEQWVDYIKGEKERLDIHIL